MGRRAGPPCHCGRKALARGLCQTHHRAAWRAEGRDPQYNAVREAARKNAAHAEANRAVREMAKTRTWSRGAALQLFSDLPGRHGGDWSGIADSLPGMSWAGCERCGSPAYYDTCAVCQNDVAAALRKTVTAREEHVLNLRFGLAGYDEHTCAEVGEVLGVTGTRVLQIEAGALRKLRRSSALGCMR